MNSTKCIDPLANNMRHSSDEKHGLKVDSHEYRGHATFHGERTMRRLYADDRKRPVGPMLCPLVQNAFSISPTSPSPSPKKMQSKAEFPRANVHIP